MSGFIFFERPIRHPAQPSDRDEFFPSTQRTRRNPVKFKRGKDDYHARLAPDPGIVMVASSVSSVLIFSDIQRMGFVAFIVSPCLSTEDKSKGCISYDTLGNTNDIHGTRGTSPASPLSVCGVVRLVPLARLTYQDTLALLRLCSYSPFPQITRWGARFPLASISRHRNSSTPFRFPSAFRHP